MVNFGSGGAMITATLSTSHSEDRDPTVFLLGEVIFATSFDPDGCDETR
jgi:hypothetical protein